MKNGAQLRRREFLRLSAVGAAGATLAACARPGGIEQQVEIVPGWGR